MNTFVNAAVGVGVLIVLVWVLIFGGTCALLARSRGGHWASGLAWGALFGPFGWPLVWWTTRGAGPGLSEGQWIGGLHSGTVEEGGDTMSLHDEDFGLG